jgi:DNA polymerase III subunit gamma/tau
MKNLAIYRKYRPRQFSDVIGQEHVVKTLTYAIGHKKPAHAYLFSGTRGVGKTSLARLIARAVNCQDDKTKHEPCNKCNHCMAIERGTAVDLIELDAASHRGIEEAKSLIESVKYPPSEMKYKVFIIDEVHMLTKEAFNSLLKTLEEPPEYVIFILATTEPQKVPETIISRCQYFELKRLTSQQIQSKVKRILKEEKIEIDKKALSFIVRSGRGSLRDTESLLEQIISQSAKKIKWQDLEEILGIVSFEVLESFIQELINENAKNSLKLINEFYEKGKDFSQLSLQIVDYLRKIILARIDKELLKHHNLDEEEMIGIVKLCKKASEKKLLTLIDKFSRAQRDIGKYPSEQMALEIAVVESCQK